MYGKRDWILQHMSNHSRKALQLMCTWLSRICSGRSASNKVYRGILPTRVLLSITIQMFIGCRQWKCLCSVLNMLGCRYSKSKIKISTVLNLVILHNSQSWTQWTYLHYLSPPVVHGLSISTTLLFKIYVGLSYKHSEFY